MLDKLKYIDVGDKKYPMAFTLNVMENVQEAYGSLEEWMKVLKPDDGAEPRIKDIKWVFREFINEGIEIENEETGKDVDLLSLKQIGRIISAIGIKETVNQITGVTISSIKDNTSKNE